MRLWVILSITAVLDNTKPLWETLRQDASAWQITLTETDSYDDLDEPVARHQRRRW
jgi:hypothetical protein